MHACRSAFRPRNSLLHEADEADEISRYPTAVTAATAVTCLPACMPPYLSHQPYKSCSVI